MKKYLLVPLALAIGAPLAHAAPLTKQVKVTAIVSPVDFTIRDEGGWMNNEQKLQVGENGSFNPIPQRLYVKASEAVTAKFTSPPTITSGRTNVPLTLNIGGVDVDAAQAKEILNKADAANGQTLQVALGAADGPYNPGSYFGYMNVVFDIAAP